MINKLLHTYTKKQIESLYEELKSIRSVAKYLNVPASSLLYYCNKLGIEINTPVRYEILNERMFLNDDEKSFYWAGFIAADGSITDNNDLKIGLSIKDKIILEDFKKYLSCDHEIKQRKNNSVHLNIRSKNICNDLRRFNVVPRKTYIYEFPKFLIEHPLVHHFMRGLFDGDGCFSSQKFKTREEIHFTILGTKKFLNDYQLIISKNINIDEKEPKAIKNVDDRIGRIFYGGNKLIGKISQFLYKDATIYLERKYKKIEHLL